MAISETARLERETEKTRDQLEHTLGELRARISPGQLFNQATGYLRNGSGRDFLGNLRDEVVRNPLPMVLVGVGVAWITIAGAVERRRSGNDNRNPARERDESSAAPQDLAGNGTDSAGRTRQAAEGLVGDVREAASEAGENMREATGDLGERLGTAYDETIGRARDTAGAWIGEARSAASGAGESLSKSARNAGERAAGVYDQTVGGARRVASKAADYGRTARQAIEPNGALMNFCREQPMLVAGLGIAIGAAIAAMLPASRVESRIMGEASEKVRQRVSNVATETLRSVAESGEDNGQKDEGDCKSADVGDDEHRTNSDPSGTWSTDESVAEVEHSVRQGIRPTTESSLQNTTPSSEAASTADFGDNGARQRN
jgi:hypothetical protein